VVYELTEKGVDLIPVLLEIIRWGGSHDACTAAPKAFLDRVRNDRDRVVNEVSAAVRQRRPAMPGKGS
jgi:DNA-binding HxlR family transcriptional regulator